MKFKELTEEDKLYIGKVYKDNSKTWDERMNILTSKYSVSERNIRKWCSEKLGLKNLNNSPSGLPNSDVLDTAKLKEHDKNKKMFLITSAQNATSLNTNFWLNMNAYAKEIDAEILVIPFRYRNPTSPTENGFNSEWWSKELIPHLTLNRHDLNSSISILSDVKIQPTNSQPLQGLESMTGEHSCVVGHPRIDLKTIPGFGDMETDPKVIFSTGCCTKPNFSDSKIGKKSEFHFCTGFSIVEIKDDKVFFFRQVSANDKTGEFIDLFYNVKDGIVKRESDIEAIVMGDIHVECTDPRVTDITINDLFKKLTPKRVFLHDVMDSQSISHHNLQDPFKLHEQEMSGTNSLEREFNNLIEWLKPFEKYETYIVKSNHDEHVDKFLKTTSLTKMTTLKNAIPYMEYSLALLNGSAKNGIVPYVINKHYPKIKCLGHNDKVIVNGYLCSTHGHIGISGSKGSPTQFSTKLSTKSVTAHTHQISRHGGNASVGTSTYLRLDYNTGPNAWSNAHGIINRLGKFQHIVFVHVNGRLEYTTLK